MMDVKELIVVTETLGVDGPERVITELINEWFKMGHKIIVIVTRSELGEATYNLNSLIKIIRIEAHKNGGIFVRFNEANSVRRILKQYPKSVGISLLVSTSFLWL